MVGIHTHRVKINRENGGGVEKSVVPQWISGSL